MVIGLLAKETFPVPCLLASVVYLGSCRYEMKIYCGKNIVTFFYFLHT